MSHYLEAAGVATTGITLVREQTEAMQLPRFLWVPFELGRPFGAPNEPAFQRRVLHDALALVERTDGPFVLADFPDDAPAGDDEAVWACPVSFAPTAVGEPELVASARSEIAKLSPWAELGTPPVPNSALALSEMVDYLAGVADGAEPDIEQIRLIADDVRTWYLHAIAQQPGQASSHDRNTFIRQSRWQHRQCQPNRQSLPTLLGMLLQRGDGLRAALDRTLVC